MGYLNLSGVKILYKLFILVAVMSLVTVGVSYVGIHAIDQLSAKTEEVRGAGGEAARASRLGQNYLNISRGEYRVAATPTAEQIDKISGLIRDEKGDFQRRVEILRKSAGPNQTAMLKKIEQAYADYLAGVEGTLSTARSVSGAVVKDEAREAVRASARKSRKVGEQLEAAMAEYVTYTSDKRNKIAKDASDSAVEIRTIMLSVAAAGVLGGILIGFVIAQFGIAKPISQSIRSLRGLAAGQLETPISGEGRKDEMGEIAEAMVVFRDNALEVQRLEEEQKQAEIRAAQERRAEMQDLAANFENSVGAIVQAVAGASQQVNGVAETVAAQATQGRATAGDVSAASEQAAANVQTVASTAEELAASISEITTQVGQSTKIASRAVDEAQKTNAMVQGLAEAAQRIGEVVDLINDIAEQTNLLALNATIEAARAGDAGKGFAVVASEVKNLASQTAKATGDISGQIDSVRTATDQAVQAINDITRIIGEMNEITSVVAAAIEEQGAATQEIARAVDEAAAGTQQVSMNMSTVMTVADHTGTAAKDMQAAAGDLSSQAGQLQTEVTAFIEKVRAA